MEMIGFVLVLIFAISLALYDGKIKKLEEMLRGPLLDLVSEEFDDLKHEAQRWIVGSFLLAVAWAPLRSLPFGPELVWTYALSFFTHWAWYAVVFPAFFNLRIMDKDIWYLGEGDYDRFFKKYLGEVPFFILKLLLFIGLEVWFLNVLTQFQTV